MKTLEDALKVYNVVPDEEFASCVSFLHSMLRLNPRDRMSARSLLSHEWLRPSATLHAAVERFA